MSKRYASFMLRWWRHGDNRELVELEQIQTGERVLLGSLDAAFDWLAAHGPAFSRAARSSPTSRSVAEPMDEPMEETG
jgi:hypothetical protein